MTDKARPLHKTSPSSTAGNGGFAQAEGGFAEADGQFAEADGQFAEADGQFAEADGQFAEAIRAQPRNLRAAQEAFADAVGEIDIAPLTEGTIVFSGIGASAHALIPAVLALRAAGRRAFAVPPGELLHVATAAVGDSFVLVSQSGASTEPLEALGHLGAAPRIAVTAHRESPLAQGAGGWLPLGPLEDTPVATLSYTATLQSLGMLCDALLGSSSDWPLVADLADGLLERFEPLAAGLAERFAAVIAVDAVGGGAARASAGETALLAREGLRLPAVGMETREYLHGPLEAVDEGFGCFVFGREREHALAAELASFGASVALVTDQREHRSPAHVVEVPRAAATAAPILQILPVQVMIDRIAALRGARIGKLRRQQSDTKVTSAP